MISREEVDAVSEAEREDDDDDDDDSELDDPDGSGFSKFRLGAVFEREILAAWEARLGTDEDVCIGGGGGDAS